MDLGLQRKDMVMMFRSTSTQYTRRNPMVIPCFYALAFNTILYKVIKFHVINIPSMV